MGDWSRLNAEQHGWLLTLRGLEGALIYGYHTAAVLTAWTISRRGGQWALSATLTRSHPLYVKQRPLTFNAPRKGGYWSWPIVALSVGERSIQATLGQPEQ